MPLGPHARFPLTQLLREVGSFPSRAAGEVVFSNPVRILQADRISDVLPCIREAADYVSGGSIVAGYLAYEAAPAFDPAFATLAPRGLPLAWLGVFRDHTVSPLCGPPHAVVGPAKWKPLVSHESQLEALARIGEWIRNGDTYQVNYTFPLEAAFDGDTLAWYRQLEAVQPSSSSAYINMGRFQVLCASPELFFEQSGDTVITRPMKGTAPRALTSEADRENARRLQHSPKDRAENLMIVDLLRNDLGRVARTGSVAVRELFAIERYDTVWQMTSTITAMTDADVPETMAALFPCGSVTGAPKIRTMQIIRDVEPDPRGVYCGAIGWWAPGRRARFSVPIRTVLVDSDTRTARFHVGSGIVADSQPEQELAECRAKTHFLIMKPAPAFELLETLRYDHGYVLLDEHLQRLADSAEYFGFVVEPPRVRRFLESNVPASGPARVRLTVARDGTPTAAVQPLEPSRPLRVAICPHPIDASDRFLYHKTTSRAVYNAARQTRPDADDVVLWNESGEVTETTIANIIVEINGRRVTPPAECGLLPGVMRGNLLRSGGIAEQVITREVLQHATRIWLINSVRGWIDAELVT